MKLGFIGYGNMASAIAQGLVEKAGMDPASIYASARNYEKLEKNAEKLGISPCRSNQEVAQRCDYSGGETISDGRSDSADKKRFKG